MTMPQSPGRVCPLHYRYSPDVFRQTSPGLSDLEVLYVVGGLYGNALALDQVLRLFEAERGRKKLVFNGDFHWFDVDPAIFNRIQHTVMAHTALRGNVETELASHTDNTEAGCGCAYPDWVDEAVVARSNRILQRLRTAAEPAHQTQLAALPMWLTASVGGLRIGIVHGDAESLAGWGFAQELLSQPGHQAKVAAWFGRADVDAFASSHTCLPVFQRIRPLPRQGAGWVFNNGAAGMPNFSGDTAGLLTRIAVSPLDGAHRRAGVVHRGVFVDAVAIEVDGAKMQQAFLAQWPGGSDAHASYFQRIVAGPDYLPEQMVRG